MNTGDHAREEVYWCIVHQRTALRTWDPGINLTASGDHGQLFAVCDLGEDCLHAHMVRKYFWIVLCCCITSKYHPRQLISGNTLGSLHGRWLYQICFQIVTISILTVHKGKPHLTYLTVGKRKFYMLPKPSWTSHCID